MVFMPFEASTSIRETKPRLVVLQRGLSQRWREMGEYLELTESRLDEIESRHGSDPLTSMRKMFKAWLSREEPPPTWKDVFEVVDEMDKDLAVKLKQTDLA